MCKRLFHLMFVLMMLAGWLGAEPMPARASSFVVNSLSDDPDSHDLNPGDGMCGDIYGLCTLRAAIEEANASPGNDLITFSITGTIDLNQGALPAITEQLKIDASGVWDASNNRPGVTLNGGNKSFSGPYLTVDNCEIYGLFFTNFLAALDTRSAYNTIGGSGSGQHNVIGDNSSYGIIIYGPGAHHNTVSGNVIGASMIGDAMPNHSGVYIAGGAHHNTIGGDTLEKGNVILGNFNDGIVITDVGSDGNRVGGNRIGTLGGGLSANFSGALENAQDVVNSRAGVRIGPGPQNTYIGGGSVVGNLIALNGTAGVLIQGAHDTWVEDNIIWGNKLYGVRIMESSTGNQILSNEIASNSPDGVLVEGAAATGNPLLANSIYDHTGKGIYLFGGGNTGLAAPVIATASDSGASGTGCAGCIIHLYSDAADEGEIYAGSTNADASGNWSYSGALTGPNVTATNTDAGGNTSEFSLPYDISNTPPNTPANPSPADGATDVGIGAALSWTGGDPDAGDTVTYDVYVGATNPPPLYQSDHPTTSFTPLLNPGVTFYWKIVARDNHGDATEGPVWSFTTASNSAPNTPSNPSPADKAGNVSLSPVFSWSGGDPDGDTVHYAVYGGEYTWVTSTLWYSGTATSFTLGVPLKPDTRYAWSIHASDDKGGLTSGPVWEFTTGASGQSHYVYLPLVVK